MSLDTYRFRFGRLLCRLVEGRARFSHTGCLVFQTSGFELYYIMVCWYFSHDRGAL